MRLMYLCLPRKKLYLTGRGDRATLALTESEVADAVAAGKLDPATFQQKSTEDLLNLLRSLSPVVRRGAGEAVGEKDDLGAEVVNTLLSMLEDDDRYACCGACGGFRASGQDSVEGAKALIEQGLKSDDPTL